MLYKQSKNKNKTKLKKVTNDLKLCINSVTSFCVLHWKKHVTVYKDIHLVKLIKKVSVLIMGLNYLKSRKTVYLKLW